MTWKIVWNDNENFKMVRCESYTEDEYFVTAVDSTGRAIKLGKRFIVSIKKAD